MAAIAIFAKPAWLKAEVGIGMFASAAQQAAVIREMAAATAVALGEAMSPEEAQVVIPVTGEMPHLIMEMEAQGLAAAAAAAVKALGSATFKALQAAALVF